MKLYEYVIRRLILMVFVLLAISAITFYITRGTLPPATAVSAYIGPASTDNARLSIAKSVGVATSACPSWNDFISRKPGCIVPLWQQYFSWLFNALRGNWGYSSLPSVAASPTLTWSVFVSRFPYTAQLAILAGVITLLIGLPMGIISATHNNKLPDHISRVTAIVGYSIPSFWFGFMLQITFVIYLAANGTALLPSSGALATQCAVCFSNPGRIGSYTSLPVVDALLSGNVQYFWDTFVAMILPALTLSIGNIAFLSRILRSSMMDVLNQDYILLARSKGLRERTVVYRHALRNALLPAITVSGLILASLLGGVVVVETVFAYPGIGAAALSASNALDLNFVELYVLIAGLIIVVTNLVVDLLYAVFDPRIRY